MTGAAETPAAASPLRIVGVDPERNFAGGETQVLGLTLALLRAGQRAELLIDPAGALWARARACGIVCHPLRIRNSVDLVAGVRLRRFLTREPFDIVHFHTARAHALAPFAAGRAAALVVTRRMDYPPNRRFAPWLYNRAVDGVAAIAPAVAEALVRAGVARERLTVIPSGVDCERFHPPDERVRREARAALGLAPDTLAVGTAGALVPRKGQRFLLEALALAKASGPGDIAAEASRLRGYIAGAGPLRAALGDDLARRGLASSVRLLGAVDDLHPLLHALDIFVMPSLNEGLGVAVLEAMAAGLPVIASDAGGLPEVVVPEATGLLVPAGDAHALARAITVLAHDSLRRTLMGAAGRERAVTHFGMEIMAQRTLKLYRGCLRTRGALRG